VTTNDTARLPGWVRKAFWTIVALEWTLVICASAVCLWVIVQLALIFSCTPDRTVYASGYSEKSWNAVRVGDSQADVRAQLGEPLDLWSTTGGEWWSYSRQRTGTDDYRERKIRFSSQGHVREKEESCWID
jgi:hypothetical protein